jgi:hypothetical protein
MSGRWILNSRGRGNYTWGGRRGGTWAKKPLTGSSTAAERTGKKAKIGESEIADSRRRRKGEARPVCACTPPPLTLPPFPSIDLQPEQSWDDAEFIEVWKDDPETQVEQGE